MGQAALQGWIRLSYWYPSLTGRWVLIHIAGYLGRILQMELPTSHNRGVSSARYHLSD